MFAAAPVYLTGKIGAGSLAVAAGDFTGDGNVDAILGDRDGSSIFRFEGSNGGTFGAPVEYAVDPANSKPRSIAVADLNKDQKLDVVVANEGEGMGMGSVSVLLGLGNGAFAPATHHATARGPRSVVVGDLDNDLRPDLVVANTAGGSFSVLKGMGNGLFGQAMHETIGGPTSLALVHASPDANLDLLVTQSHLGASRIHLYNGNGMLKFAVSSQVNVGADPSAVAIGDGDGDGKHDMATVGLGNADVTLLYGDGMGNLKQTMRSVALGRSARSVVSTDFNGDCKQDLAVALVGAAEVVLLIGQGGGMFQEGGRYAAGRAYAVAVADVNRDGKPDLLVANEVGGLVVLVNASS